MHIICTELFIYSMAASFVSTLGIKYNFYLVEAHTNHEHRTLESLLVIHRTVKFQYPRDVRKRSSIYKERCSHVSDLTLSNSFSISLRGSKNLQYV